MTEIREIASGLQFPEGPVWLPDGSVVLVEIARGAVTRVHPDGRTSLVAETGGGPNGAALGPFGCHARPPTIRSPEPSSSTSSTRPCSPSKSRQPISRSLAASASVRHLVTG